MPLVTIVVICFNDAANLPAALRSATSQTLSDIEVVVVDDGSTDGTPGVAQSFVDEDPRVRYVRLDVNSGGCSRPRNTGLESATGDYVTFLDSDDVLPRRACERLHRAVKSADADMACGRVVRRHHDPVRYLPFNDDLYRRPGVVDAIAARPELLRDSIAVGKLYSRRWALDAGLRFPEGMLHEDLLFTTEAYFAARRIAVVPKLVYLYDVRPAHAESSITTRRDLQKWRDRFEIHRRIDAFLDQRDATTDLRIVKDRKFLDVDFTVFLRQLRHHTRPERPELAELAADYLRTVDVTRAKPATPLRVAATLASYDGVDELALAADYVVNGGIGSDLVVDGDRLRWSALHPDDDRLDVTDSGLLTASFARTPFLCSVRHARWDDARLHVDGVVSDVLGRLSPIDDLRARLHVTGRVGGSLWSVDALLTPRGGGVAFAAGIDLAKLGRRLGRPTVGHELRLLLELRQGTDVVRRPLSARDAELSPDVHPLPTPWRAVVGDQVRLAEVNGRLVLQLTELPAVTRSAIAGASWARAAARAAAGRLAR